MRLTSAVYETHLCFTFHWDDVTHNKSLFILIIYSFIFTNNWTQQLCKCLFRNSRLSWAKLKAMFFCLFVFFVVQQAKRKQGCPSGPVSTKRLLSGRKALAGLGWWRWYLFFLFDIETSEQGWSGCMKWSNQKKSNGGITSILLQQTLVRTSE